MSLILILFIYFAIESKGS